MEASEEGVQVEGGYSFTYITGMANSYDDYMTTEVGEAQGALLRQPGGAGGCHPDVLTNWVAGILQARTRAISACPTRAPVHPRVCGLGVIRERAAEGWQGRTQPIGGVVF